MTFDTNKYRLGTLCKHKHEYCDGKSLRYVRKRDCVQCHDMHRKKSAMKNGRKFKTTLVICKNCSKEFPKCNSHVKKHVNHFCSCSCSATYNNRHRKLSYRRSKLELYIEKTLRKEYPNLKILFNDKIAIGSELDIYFPTLKLAVELNGIFHYEPIYGEQTFSRIQNNDKLKTIHCYEKGIELLVIDTVAKGKRKYYNIIKRILNTKLSAV